MNYPYDGGGIIDGDNGVEMVGHDNGRTQFDLGVTGRNGLPGVNKDLSGLIENYFTVGDFAKKRFAFMGDKGDEVITWLGIIVIAEAEGFTVRLVRVHYVGVIHYW